MLVRINNNRFGLLHASEGLCGLVVQSRDQLEISAVRSVDVNAEGVSIAQGQHFVERINRAGSRCTQGHHHGAHVSSLQRGLKRGHVHAAAMVGSYRMEWQAEHRADAAVCVVRLLRSDNALARSQLAGNPERLKIGEGSPAGEMTQEICPTK